MPVEIAAPRILLVEGKDEELFFRSLIEHMGLQNIQILGIAGKTKLRPNLKALTLSPHFPEVISLGVVRGAETIRGLLFKVFAMPCKPQTCLSLNTRSWPPGDDYDPP